MLDFLLTSLGFAILYGFWFLVFGWLAWRLMRWWQDPATELARERQKREGNRIWWLT